MICSSGGTEMGRAQISRVRRARARPHPHYCKDALSALPRAGRKLDEWSRVLNVLLSDLGNAYCLAGEMAEGIRLLERALPIYECYLPLDQVDDLRMRMRWTSSEWATFGENGQPARRSTAARC